MFSEDDDRWDRDDDWGDPRRCPRHPQVITSSADGMVDGLCYICESGEDEPPPTHAVTLDITATAQPLVTIDDDEIPF